MTSVPIALESRPERPPEGTAAADLLDVPIGQLRSVVARATPADVERALRSTRPSLADFAALLSAPAAERLEDLATRANRITRARFGATVRLFAPLYLSNECVSSCPY